jgi:hypothetical protein
MPKRGSPLTQPKPIDSSNPLSDYATLRGLSRRLRCSPTTAGRIVSQLDLPFVVLSGKKLYRFSAIRGSLASTRDDPERRA